MLTAGLPPAADVAFAASAAAELRRVLAQQAKDQDTLQQLQERLVVLERRRVGLAAVIESYGGAPIPEASAPATPPAPEPAPPAESADLDPVRTETIQRLETVLATLPRNEVVRAVPRKALSGDAALIAAFERDKGVTRCPAAYGTYSTATISEADRAALVAHSEVVEKARLEKPVKGTWTQRKRAS